MHYIASHNVRCLYMARLIIACTFAEVFKGNHAQRILYLPSDFWQTCLSEICCSSPSVYFNWYQQNTGVKFIVCVFTYFAISADSECINQPQPQDVENIYRLVQLTFFFFKAHNVIYVGLTHNMKCFAPCRWGNTGLLICQFDRNPDDRNRGGSFCTLAGSSHKSVA